MESRGGGCEPPFPWLARIATNAARDYWSKRSPLSFADLGEQAETLEDDLVGPEPSRERGELLDRLALGVRQLRPEYRLVIALRYDAGFSYEETAKALSIPVNTVRTHLRRAKSALRSWLEVEDARLDG
jgi:RNA polymerase sigma-70 factor (ECF subfamily)